MLSHSSAEVKVDPRGKTSRPDVIGRLLLTVTYKYIVLSDSSSQLRMSSIPTPLTFAYLTVDKLELKLDLYLPLSVTGALPAIICFHGRGLLVGNHQPGPMLAVWFLG